MPNVSSIQDEKYNRTIFRKAHNRENPYAQISKKILRDKRMSAKGMGIMCYFLSLPDNWEINIKELVRNFSDGEKSIRAAIKELVLLGYIEMQQSRAERGRFSSTMFLIHEEPRKPLTSLPNHNFSPYARKRHAVNRHAEKGVLLNTEYTEKNKLLKNNNKQPPKPEAEKPPSVEDDRVVVDLMKKAEGWAISKSLLKSWLKQHSAEYILEKIEYTEANSRTNPGGFLRKAIEHDYKPPMALETAQAKKPPEEQNWPSHEENMAWYEGLSEPDKQGYFDEANRKHPYFEEMLKIEKIDFKSVNFLKSHWFKMMMQLVGRAK